MRKENTDCYPFHGITITCSRVAEASNCKNQKLSKKVSLECCIFLDADNNYISFELTYCFASANLSIGSPVGSGAFLSTLYFNNSGKSIPTITFLPAATISDFGISNL